ncbi:DUF3667 domain-containing protein [Caulobacter sp.]|jgi:hypothetical protein|uniref:DUF3667 domain-containing protein n=1 Tax=Caulobacter sp. TaxID=78 RepID=UPI00160A13BB
MTGPELEAATADSAGTFLARKKKPFTHVGEPCKNCDTPLEGWFCHSCGQNADTHHRSILHLIWETIEGMFHFDGRLATTLPLLFFKPGKLAKDLMEGRIARHAPPFRTFLVALLLFIFSAEHLIHNQMHEQEVQAEKQAQQLTTPAGRKARADEMRQSATSDRDERLKSAAEDRDEALKAADADKAKIAVDYDADVKKAQDLYAATVAEANALQNNPNAGAEALAKLHNSKSEAADKVRSLEFSDPAALEDSANRLAEVQIAGQRVTVVKPGEAGHGSADKADHAPKTQTHAADGHKAKEAGWKEGLAKAVANPNYFILVMFGWAHRLAVLLLPIVGLSLALVYVNKRQYFIYDHLLVATNLMSFSFLTWAVLFVLPQAVMGPFLVIIMLWGPINLFQTLRGGYDSSIPGALIKTLIVWFTTVIAFAVLLLGLMLFTLSQM